MPWDLSPFADVGLDKAQLEAMLGEHESDVRPWLEKLWSYYRNPISPEGSFRAARTGAWTPRGAAASGEGPGPSASRLAQAAGLPDRLNPLRSSAATAREVVIENDIAWRIDTLVDFLFGKPIRLLSTARDPQRRRAIEDALEAVWDASGGIALLQDAALLGCVYGSVDLVLRFAAPFDARASSRSPAELLRIEAVEAPRGVPMLDPSDYRRLVSYVIRAAARTRPVEPASMLERVVRRVRLGNDDRARPAHAHTEIVEILSPAWRQVYADGAVLVDEPNPLGVLPVVHIQNASQPFRYEGLSDVEPLIPLQDELNIRLSDRAHRVTLQSFNMYLAKGLDVGAAGSSQPQGLRVAPGQVWLTDNPDASVQAFGGDGQSPSEERHVDELREALDKASGVSPVVIGVIREKLGHLSSENAIRITLTGVLGKTQRKRIAYGRGILHMSALILEALDRAGVLPTEPADRALRLEWPDPLPTDERARLTAALMKRDLGVPAERLLRELGYHDEHAAP